MTSCTGGQHKKNSHDNESKIVKIKKTIKIKELETVSSDVPVIAELAPTPFPSREGKDTGKKEKGAMEGEHNGRRLEGRRWEGRRWEVGKKRKRSKGKWKKGRGEKGKEREMEGKGENGKGGKGGREGEKEKRGEKKGIEVKEKGEKE